MLPFSGRLCAGWRSLRSGSPEGVPHDFGWDHYRLRHSRISAEAGRRRAPARRGRPPALAALDQNEKLVNALYEAREQISSLKEEVDKLCAPPSTYGVYLSVNEDATVNILSQGRKVKVNLHPSIKAETLKPGQELVLNEGLNVVEAAGYEIQGDVVILKEMLE